MVQRGGPKQSVEVVNNRRSQVRKVLEQLHKEGKPPTLGNMRAKLKGITRTTLYNDRKALSRENTFIADLAESNYSQYANDIWDMLNWIESVAVDNYTKDWQVTKTTVKQLPTGEVHEATTMTDEARPKAMFLHLTKDVQDVKLKFLSGENIDLSVALLARKLDNYKEELELAKRERDELREKLEAKPTPTSSVD